MFNPPILYCEELAHAQTAGTSLKIRFASIGHMSTCTSDSVSFETILGSLHSASYCNCFVAHAYISIYIHTYIHTYMHSHAHKRMVPRVLNPSETILASEISLLISMLQPLPLTNVDKRRE